MKILINDNTEIVAYAAFGDLAGSFEFTGSIPDDFKSDFKPSYYLYQDSKIVVNPNYEEPTIPEQPSGPSPEMLAINALGVQVAKLMSEKGGV